MASRRSILVVGVSRSGTSLTTSLLHASGAVGRFDHGERGRGGYNEFETEWMYQLNEKTLHAHGRAWKGEARSQCYAPLLGPSYTWPAALLEQGAQTVAALRSSLPAGGTLVLKDPRLSWTLGLWTAALAPGGRHGMWCMCTCAWLP